MTDRMKVFGAPTNVPKGEDVGGDVPPPHAKHETFGFLESVKINHVSSLYIQILIMTATQLTEI